MNLFYCSKVGSKEGITFNYLIEVSRHTGISVHNLQVHLSNKSTYGFIGIWYITHCIHTKNPLKKGRKDAFKKKT
jgi:hypothetical protein